MLGRSCHGLLGPGYLTVLTIDSGGPFRWGLVSVVWSRRRAI